MVLQWDSYAIIIALLTGKRRPIYMTFPVTGDNLVTGKIVNIILVTIYILYRQRIRERSVPYQWSSRIYKMVCPQILTNGFYW